MTESNVNDRRFWMVVGQTENSGYDCLDDMNVECYTFADQKSAEEIAERYVGLYKNVFVLEAVSRYTIPEPRVVKQNLHIPPLSRGDSNE